MKGRKPTREERALLAMLTALESEPETDAPATPAVPSRSGRMRDRRRRLRALKESGPIRRRPKRIIVRTDGITTVKTFVI